MTELSPRRRRFAEEFVRDLDARAAAERAGYCAGRARGIGRKLLAEPAVQDAISHAARAPKAAGGVTPEAVIEGFANIAFARVTDYVGLDEASLAALAPEKLAAIQEVSVEPPVPPVTRGAPDDDAPPARAVRVKLGDKKAALVELARILGLHQNTRSVDDDLRHLSDTERAQRILALLERARARGDGSAADERGADLAPADR